MPNVVFDTTKYFTVEITEPSIEGSVEVDRGSFYESIDVDPEVALNSDGSITVNGHSELSLIPAIQKELVDDIPSDSRGVFVIGDQNNIIVTWG